jgi:hypothetical protein
MKVFLWRRDYVNSVPYLRAISLICTRVSCFGGTPGDGRCREISRPASDRERSTPSSTRSRGGQCGPWSLGRSDSSGVSDKSRIDRSGKTPQPTRPVPTINLNRLAMHLTGKSDLPERLE